MKKILTVTVSSRYVVFLDLLPLLCTTRMRIFSDAQVNIANLIEVFQFSRIRIRIRMERKLTLFDVVYDVRSTKMWTNILEMIVNVLFVQLNDRHKILSPFAFLCYVRITRVIYENMSSVNTKQSLLFRPLRYVFFQNQFQRRLDSCEK